MKNMVVCFKVSKVYFFLTIIIIISGITFFGRQSFYDIQNLEESDVEIIEKDVQLNEVEEKIEAISANIIDLDRGEEYKTMPKEIEGYKVIGKIQIPKIELETYILEETNKNTLNVSVTKLYGPGINEVGNFCIAGHNYNKMFGKIKKLEMKDNIILTDTYDNSVTYEVYDNFQTSPKDVSCLHQNTDGDRELTLITCTKGAIKRIIIKAVEVCD